MTKRNKELVQQSFGLLGDAAGPLSRTFSPCFAAISSARA
jgi:hypothetical protein